MRRRVDSRWTTSTLIFALLLIAFALPVLFFEYFPSEDGPGHIANGAIYLEAGHGPLSEYFQIDLFPIAPNILGDLLIAGLLAFFSPELTERIFAAVLLVGLPVAVRWCICLINGDAVWLSLLAIPLGGSFLLYFGIYNFVIGVVLSVLALGYWIGRLRSGRPTTGSTLGLAGLMLAVYLSHPIPLLALVLFASATSLDCALRSCDQHSRAQLRCYVAYVGSVFAAAALPVGLLLAFGSDQNLGFAYSRSLLTRVLAFPLDALVALSSYEIPFALVASLVIWLLLALAFIRFRDQLAERLAFLIASLSLVVVYFAAPDSIGNGSVILPRTMLYILIGFLLALAHIKFPQKIERLTVVLAVVVIFGLTITRFASHAALDDEIRDYLAGEVVLEENSTVLPIWMVPVELGVGPGGSERRTKPLLERVGYLTASHSTINLAHFSVFDTFAFQFPAGVAIRASGDRSHGFPSGAGLEGWPFFSGPGLVDIERFEQSGLGKVDYVWLWGRSIAEPDVLSSEPARRLMRQLGDDFVRVFISDTGRLEVYAREGGGSP